MGVLTCHRKGCENIMCDRYSHEFGYICEECFEELRNLSSDTDIKGFMDSPKKDNEENGLNLLNEIFKKR